jgi:hypothetical protein
MKKPFLIVIALGLLSSSAFAVEKTRTQEDSDHLFRVEGKRKFEYTRFIPSEKSRRIEFFTSLNPDCTVMGEIEVRITKEPKHGKVDTAAGADGYPGYPKTSDRYKCNEQKVQGTQVNYTSEANYIGNDVVDLLVLFPSGLAYEVHYNVNVR